MASREQTCMNCMHRHENQCRRYPAQVTVLVVPVTTSLGGLKPEITRLGAYPEASAEQWCGEWASLFRVH